MSFETELKPLVKLARTKGWTAAEVVQAANIKQVERALGDSWSEPHAEGGGDSGEPPRKVMFSVDRGSQAHGVPSSSGSPEPRPDPPADDGASSDEGQAETIAADNPFAALGGGSSDSGSESSDE